MSAGLSVAVAATFVWLGMVLAISFIEAPLKFRAPGVTLPIGLGIGRLVFRALTRRSDAVLAGADGPRSHAHLWYVGLELVKVVALAATGILLLASA